MDLFGWDGVFVGEGSLTERGEREREREGGREEREGATCHDLCAVKCAAHAQGDAWTCMPNPRAVFC